MDNESFNTRLSTKLKAERALRKPAGLPPLVFAGIVIAISVVAGIIALRTWIGY